MPSGGSRPGAGRPKGSKNKRTIAKEQAFRSHGPDPLDHLEAVMNDTSADRQLRLEAAKALAPYKHPRLSSTEITEHAAPPSEDEILQELAKPEMVQQLISLLASVARDNPAVLAQLRSILDGPQEVKTGTEA